jgi:hypothetical protein
MRAVFRIKVAAPDRGVQLTLGSDGLVFGMKRHVSLCVLWLFIAAGGLFLSACSTVGTRIEKNRTAFEQLSPKERALVSEGKISVGMSQMAVYLAWGQPQQKATGVVRNSPTESWVYTVTTSAYGPYGYGPYWYGGWGGYAGVRYLGFHHGRRFYGAFAYPWWDPFYYPFAATIQYPEKMVSFQNGKVVAFQFLSPGY